MKPDERELLAQAKEIIAKGCGCDRACEVNKDCGCEMDAMLVIALVRGHDE